MIIAIDFDSTLFLSGYPDAREEVPGAFHWVRQFAAAGAKLILWTCRSDQESHGSSSSLTDAVEWCRARGVEFWGVNANPDQVVWTASPKPFADVVIDDAGFGVPLVCTNPGVKPFVDWNLVGPAVLAKIQAKAVTHQRLSSSERRRRDPWLRGEIVARPTTADRRSFDSLVTTITSAESTAFQPRFEELPRR